MDEDRTVTTYADNGDVPPRGTCPALVVALDADHPTTPGARYSLDEIDSVQLGRGREQRVQRSERTLEIRCLGAGSERESEGR